MAKCPECKHPKAYIHDYGCTSCGLGNPFRGIACLTPAASRVLPIKDKPTPEPGESDDG